eukprot:2851450-Rhodomonas_salina.1
MGERRGHVVLFGGSDGNRALNDTFLLDRSVPYMIPSCLIGQCLVLHAAGTYVVRFRICTRSSYTWSRLTTSFPLPDPRAGHAAVALPSGLL